MATQSCFCCGLSKSEDLIAGDLRISGQSRLDFKDIAIAAQEGCQDCCLIHDAVTTGYSALENQGLEEQIILISASPDTKSVKIYVQHQVYPDLEIVRVTDCRGSPKARCLPTFSWDVKTLYSLSESTSSRETLKIIADWTAECVAHHECTEKGTPSTGPKRVLEITSDFVYLRENLNISTYAAVSHCWGPKGVAKKLTSDTHNSLQQGYPVEELPTNFRDAVHLCQKLGLVYIWIDALCILQDSKEDWEEAAATMADIYEHAYITIAATHSQDSEGGLFSSERSVAHRLRKHPHLYVREIPPNFPAAYPDWSGGVPEPESERLWPLLSRAWVYQERRLSPRIVHFGRHQVYWECKHRFASEDSGEDESREVPQASNSGYWGADLTLGWQKSVTDYTGLRLTFESDRLPAIAALALRMSRIQSTDNIYIAGLWRNSILCDLCWHFISNNYKPRPDRSIPTWSWASVQGAQITWSNPKPLSNIEIAKIDFTAVGPAHLGAVVDASIKLKAPVITLTNAGGLSSGDVGDLEHVLYYPTELLTTHLATYGLTLYGVSIDYDLMTANPPFTSGTIIKFMILQYKSWEITGLVLRSLPGTSREWERIGWLQTWEPDDVKDRRLQWETANVDKIGVEEAPYDAFFDSLPWEELKIV